jgi:hypothetical protein
LLRDRKEGEDGRGQFEIKYEKKIDGPTVFLSNKTSKFEIPHVKNKMVCITQTHTKLMGFVL